MHSKYKDKEIFAGKKFVRWLMSRGLLVEDPDGSLILYFKNKAWKHAGVWMSGKVISKWGSDWYKYEHADLHVPSKYGEPKRYKNLSEERWFDLFKQYVRGKVSADDWDEANGKGWMN